MATQPTTTAPQCCLCGNWLQFGAKPLYGYEVCPKCYSDFAWKRAFAYIIDIVIVNAIVGVLIVVALIVGAIVVGAAGNNNDAAATAGGMIIVFGYLGSFLMAYVLITLRDGWGGESPAHHFPASTGFKPDGPSVPDSNAVNEANSLLLLKACFKDNRKMPK